jgi:glycine betaine/proline transport system permease protein
VAVATPPRVQVPIAPPKTQREAPANPWVRRIVWTLAALVVAAIGLIVLRPGFPERFVIDITQIFDDIGDWVIQNSATSPLFVYVLTPIRDGLGTLFDTTVTVLERMTWFGLVVTAAMIAGVVAGWKMAILTAAGFLSFGLLGVWEASLETLALMLVAVGLALAIGIPVGLWAGRKPRVERFLRPVLDAMQTIPAYSYLLPFVLLFGIGEPPALMATLVFALPPAIRLTALGIRTVPETSIEVASAFGSTSRQTLRQVQVPLAKPSIMLGVNQTIMMALGMVVIAAFVGAGGLGQTVILGLQQLNVGRALDGGVAIVVMAIMLDRVTTAWSKRDPRVRKPLRLGGWSLERRAVLIAALVASVGAIFLGRQVLRQQEFPDQWSVSLERPANAIVEWSQQSFHAVASATSDGLIVWLLDPLEELLTGVPWWMVAGAFALIGLRLSGWRLGLGVFACITGLGVLGMWDVSMGTLASVLVAVAITTAFAIPLGVVAARSDRFERWSRGVLDAMQTMPAFVYLVPVLLLFEPGRVPAIIASFIYALPVGVRLTNLGIREVPTDMVEAGDSFGSTSWQLLRKVQLPSAKASILLGVNQTIMMVLSVVIIAGLIGAAGLGQEVVFALGKQQIGRGVVAGACILLLAVSLDRLTQAMGAAPRTTRGPIGGMGFTRWTKIKVMRGEVPADDGGDEGREEE